MVPRVGQKIGPYEILGRLGSGGMGLVFSAWDARLHRDVAIKLLKDEFLTPTMRSRFLGEARAASRLNHPNICTVFDIGEEQDCPYMVMELLKGETLRGRMQQGPIPNETILQVGIQMADALSVAHEQGVVHRDIKPANVVLVGKQNGTFQTKVLDFGLAKFDMDGLDSHSGLTTTGMTVGTVSYMSPEQARGELLDGRSDLFSVGVLLYEMATRRLPFDGATSALVFVQLLNHPPEPLRTLNANVPRSLEQVINTCLQKNRDDRYQTAHELVAALRKASEGLGSEEKTSASWFSKLTTGLKRESLTTTSSQNENDAVDASEPPPSLQMSSEEAFLKPFRPQRKSGGPSRHYEPINAPYSTSEEHAGDEDQKAKGTLDQAINEGTSDETHAPAVASGSLRQVSIETSASDKASGTITPRLNWLDDVIEAPPLDVQEVVEDKLPSWRGWRMLFGSLLAAAILVATIGIVISKRRANAPGAIKTVVISAVANHTGDSSLAAVTTAGMELALQQSPWIGVRGSGANDDLVVSELPQKGTLEFATLQRAAKATGAAAFVLGEIHTEGPTYTFSLHVYDTAKGLLIGECASTAASRERMMGAVDALATSLRSVLGESPATISRASLPLSKVATGNIDALIAYSEGNHLEAQGLVVAAIASFEQAASLDPQFAQSYLRLADLYRKQHAELSAAVAANHAEDASNGDEHVKLVAGGMQALVATGDLQKAASLFMQVTQQYPSDLAGFILLARAQYEAGNYAEALATAREAVRLAPSDRTSVELEQRSLIALDRPDEALQLKVGDSASSLSSADLLASFVQFGAEPADKQTIGASSALDAQMTAAELLDATGQLAAGLTKWRTVVQTVAAVPQLLSSAAYALSQASLNRALAGDCIAASELEREASAYPAGLQSTFTLGMSSGLCGNVNDVHVRLATLTATYPQSTLVSGFYTSDLNAVMQWKSGELADALVTLRSAKNYDSVSYNQYIRGQVYFAQRQPQPATVEFQASLRHIGALVLVNPEALPMTYVALARAFAANGDVGNATQTYKKLLAVFRNADPVNPLLTEAQLATAQ